MMTTTLLLLEPGARWPAFLDRCPSDSHALVVFPRGADETYRQWMDRLRRRAERFERSGARVTTTVVATPDDADSSTVLGGELLHTLASLPATRHCRILRDGPSGPVNLAPELASTTPSPAAADRSPPTRSGPRAATSPIRPEDAPPSVAPAA